MVADLTALLKNDGSGSLMDLDGPDVPHEHITNRLQSATDTAISNQVGKLQPSTHHAVSIKQVVASGLRDRESERLNGTVWAGCAQWHTIRTQVLGAYRTQDSAWASYPCAR